MSFKLDYRSLRDISLSLNSNKTIWEENARKIDDAFSKISEGGYIEGTGADSIKLYINSVHKIIFNSLSLLFTYHSLNFNVFYNDFLNTVDSSSDTRIFSDELEEIKKLFKNNNNTALSVDYEVAQALRNVSDIFYHSKRNIDYVNSCHTTAINNIDNVLSKVKLVDQRHVNADFTETAQLLATLKSFIDECVCKTRSFKSNFTNESFASLKSAESLFTALSVSEEKFNREYDKYIEANNNVSDSIKSLSEIEQKEREQRERIGNIIKFAVETVAVVASVAVVVLTAGAATPLLLGTVGAITAVATTATKKVTDHYIESGDVFKTLNWKETLIDVGVAGTVGFITGYAGGALVKGLGNTKTIGGLMHSSSKIVSFASNLTIDVAQETGDGVVKRFGDEVGGRLKNKDDKVDFSEVFNGKKMLKDAGDGAIDSTLGQITDGITDSKKLKKLYDSDKKSTRIFSNAVTDGFEKVVSGTGQRAFDAVVDGENVKDAVLDYGEMADDFVKGSTKSGAKEYVADYYGQKLSKDDVAKMNLPNGTPDAEDWMKNGGKVYQSSDGKYVFEEKKEPKFGDAFKLKWTDDRPATVTYTKTTGRVVKSRSTTNNTETFKGMFIPAFDGGF